MSSPEPDTTPFPSPAGAFGLLVSTPLERGSSDPSLNLIEHLDHPCSGTWSLTVWLGRLHSGLHPPSLRIT